MIFPVPTLDHVVVNARDRIDAAAEVYRRLGFTLTPRGYHTLGSVNHLAMFGTDYLELIAVPAEESNPVASNGARRREILAAPEGLNGLVFGTEDAVATWRAMAAAGVPVFPPDEFSRPVALPEGAEDAVFRTVRLRPGVAPAGRLYFCQHFSRRLVWRDEWRHHANGATGIARAVVVARDPSELAGLFRRMFGDDAVRPVEGPAGGASGITREGGNSAAAGPGWVLTVGVSRFDIVTPEALHAEFGDACPDGGGRDSFMAALVFRTRSLDAAWRAMRDGGISGAHQHGGRVVVPAREAFGATLAFCV